MVELTSKTTWELMYTGQRTKQHSPRREGFHEAAGANRLINGATHSNGFEWPILLIFLI